MIPDEEADRLAAVAVELVDRVRYDDPAANGRWLQSVLPDPSDWFRLCFMLACAVPDDRSWQSLTGWFGFEPARRELQPHGTGGSRCAASVPARGAVSAVPGRGACAGPEPKAGAAEGGEGAA